VLLLLLAAQVGFYTSACRALADVPPLPLPSCADAPLRAPARWPRSQPLAELGLLRYRSGPDGPQRRRLSLSASAAAKATKAAPLPYGGDAQAAMRAGDRAAIRAIMAARQARENGGGRGAGTGKRQPAAASPPPPPPRVGFVGSAAAAAADGVSGRFHIYAAVLTEIRLHAACSCHEITEWKRPGQGGWSRGLTPLRALCAVSERTGVVDWHAPICQHWTFGERGAQRALEVFLRDTVADFDDPEKRFRADGRHTAELSPYLKFGELSPRELSGAGPELMSRPRAD
jgi:hypothetical protein